MEDGLLEDLRAEGDVLDDLLRGLSDAAWHRPTPAAGWTIADTVHHLVVAERAATTSVRDGVDFAGEPRASAPTAERAAPLAAWRAARRTTLEAFAAAADDARVPWGGRLMSVRSLATARLMETWAHGLDCFAAVGREPTDTDRLRHVAWLGWRTLPFAFVRAGEAPPAPIEQLRIELTAPSGAVWALGACEANSTDRLSGSASAWCRVVTHRWREPQPAPLETDGALATAALGVAQAYLDA